MMRNPPFAESVNRHGIAVYFAIGTGLVVGRWPGMRMCETPRGEKTDAVAKALARQMGRAPYVVVPLDDCPRSVEAGAKMHAHGGAERRPAQLIGATPHAHHRNPRLPRQQCGVQRHVVGAIVPVATGALGMD